jgi:hypothetical protein
MFCFPFLQRAGLEQLVADLPLRLQSFTDKDDFYLALLQVGSVLARTVRCAAAASMST